VRFSKVEENIFFKMRLETLSDVNFYNADVVTRDRRMDSRLKNCFGQQNLFS
jgi:hypothetical protein